jgi:hypothetical protein
MKPHSVGVVLSHAKHGRTGGWKDGRTDSQRINVQTEMRQLIVAFRKLTNAFNVSS